MNLPQQSKVYIAIGATVMRKSINGLCKLVADNFEVKKGVKEEGSNLCLTPAHLEVTFLFLQTAVLNTVLILF